MHTVLDIIEKRYNIDRLDEDWMELKGQVYTHCPGDNGEEPITISTRITQNVLFKVEDTFMPLEEFGNYWVLIAHCMKHRVIVVDSLHWKCESRPFLLPLTKEFIEEFEKSCKDKESEVLSTLKEMPQRFKLGEFMMGEAQVVVN